jgi:serine/threonine protein kinase
MAFVDSFWSALESNSAEGVPVPTAKDVNEVLKTHQVPLAIQAPNLVRTQGNTILLVQEASEPTEALSFHGYELGPQIGQGGFGTVYRASRRHSGGDFVFALKILEPSFSTPEGSAKAAKRFSREARVLARLQHRAIVQFVDSGVDQKGRPFLVMPLIEGKNLRDAAAEMVPKQVLLTFLEFTSGLEFAHGKDVLHRDLKPNNILVRSSDQQPIVLDFGLAYAFDDADSQSLTTATVAGTLGYMPPEVLDDPKKRNPLHDVYSCGVILYELFAGKRPQTAAYRSLAEVNPELELLDSIVKRGTAAAKERYQSIAELRSAVSELLPRLQTPSARSNSVVPPARAGSTTDVAGSPTGGELTANDLYLLGHIASQCRMPDGFATQWSLDEVVRMSPLAFGVSLRRLQQRGMVTIESRVMRHRFDEDQVDGIFATARAFEWIDANQVRVEAEMRRRDVGEQLAEPPPFDDSDIPF